MSKIAVVVPPMSDLNTLYSAAPRLAAWLRGLGHEVAVVDLSLETALAIFSRTGLARIFDAIDPRALDGVYEDVYANRDRYLRVIDDAIAFVQGRDLAFAHRIVRGDHLPEGPLFRDEPAARRRERFGAWGKVDLARHMVTLMVLDLTKLIQTLSPHFNLFSYAAKLLDTAHSFDGLERELLRPPGVVDEIVHELAARALAPDVDLVCFTCPFPGMLFGSLDLGRWLAANRPRARRALGGGYPSTELRQVEDPRLFECIDYLVLDDGERPLERILARLNGAPATPLTKTFTREDGRVVLHDDPGARAPRFRDLPAPDYRGVRMDRYLHFLTAGENVFQRLLNDGPWLKLTAAHGCYWKKCTFCDIHLDYIDDFDPLSAQRLADQMDELHAQTGLSSFHFTDEAAPPPLLVNLALELLRRDRGYQYFGNIRYDPGFTPDRCRLLAASGMIAVTGGIEIASDALLPKIDKGITVAQVTKVLQAFREAGIMTHAYLIYGFPGETPQDSINGVETLRQLFAADLLQSAFYHRFSLSAHAPVARDPERFGIRLKPSPFRGFAHYELPYESMSVPHPTEAMATVLVKMVDAYVHRRYLDADVRTWFGPGAAVAPTVPPDLVSRTLVEPHPWKVGEGRLCWLGGTPRWSHGLLTVSCQGGEIYSGTVPRAVADNLARCHPSGWTAGSPPRAAELGEGWAGPLRSRGLVLV